MTIPKSTVIIAIEIGVVALLSVHVYSQYSATKISVSPVPRESLLFPTDGKFKLFHELSPSRGSENLYVPAWLPYRPEFTVNTDTLNDRFSYATRTPPHTFRIITLGDSWTYGQFVSTTNNYTELLEEYLNTRVRCTGNTRFEVINLGVPNYDIQYSVERYRRRGQKYNPDLVLWLLIPNDLDEIQEFVDGRTALYLEQMRESGELDVDTASIGNALTQFKKPLEAYLRARRDLVDEMGIQALIQFQKKALASINTYYHGPLMLFSLPSGGQIGEEYLPLIKDFTLSRDNTSYYESPVDLRQKGRLLPDGHPSDQGHALIAEDLFKQLTEQRLIPCKN